MRGPDRNPAHRLHRGLLLRNLRPRDLHPSVHVERPRRAGRSCTGPSTPSRTSHCHGRPACRDVPGIASGWMPEPTGAASARAGKRRGVAATTAAPATVQPASCSAAAASRSVAPLVTMSSTMTAGAPGHGGGRRRKGPGEVQRPGVGVEPRRVADRADQPQRLPPGASLRGSSRRTWSPPRARRAPALDGTGTRTPGRAGLRGERCGEQSPQRRHEVASVAFLVGEQRRTDRAVVDGTCRHAEPGHVHQLHLRCGAPRAQRRAGGSASQAVPRQHQIDEVAGGGQQRRNGHRSMLRPAGPSRCSERAVVDNSYSR